MSGHTAPMVHMTPALWTMAALFLLAGLLMLSSALAPIVWWFLAMWTVIRRDIKSTPRRRRRRGRRYHVVSWRVLWWRRHASPARVSRRTASLEHHLSDLEPLAAYFNAPVADGDRARRP